MFKKANLILGRDLDEQLIKTLQMLDSESLLDFIQNQEILLNPRIQMQIELNQGKFFSWESLVNEENEGTFSYEGLDLMKKMLDLNPLRRASVGECLSHSFLRQ